MEYLEGYYKGVEDGYKHVYSYIKGRQDFAKELNDVNGVLIYEPILRRLEEAMEYRNTLYNDLEKAIKED